MNDRNDKAIDPTVILSVSGPDGLPMDAPLFAAVSLTAEMLHRLELLTNLCDKHLLIGVTTADLPRPIYWDIPACSPLADLADVETTWHAHGDTYSAELRGRRPTQNGEYGKIQVIAYSYIFGLDDCRTWRNQEYAIAFQASEEHEALWTEYPFGLRVYQRMIEMHLWPEDEPPPL